MPFWRKFAHLNDAMLYGNNALVPDPTKVGVRRRTPCTLSAC